MSYIIVKFDDGSQKVINGMKAFKGQQIVDPETLKVAEVVYSTYAQ